MEVAKQMKLYTVQWGGCEANDWSVEHAAETNQGVLPSIMVKANYFEHFISVTTRKVADTFTKL